MQALKSLFLVATLAAAGAAQAALPNSVWFDGYCDGVTNITKHSNGIVTGTYDVNSNGCSYGTYPAVGKTDKKGASGLYDTGGVFYNILVRINEDHTWSYYFSDGTLANMGTWSAGSNASQNRGTTPSMPAR